MKSTKVRNFIKVVVFMMIMLFVGQRLYQVLLWKNSSDNNLYNVKHFYDTPKEKIEVLFLGSSHCFCTVNNALLWEKYGMASQNFATGRQNLGNTYYFLKEALKTQKPEVVCVEGVFSSYTGYGNGDVYRNTLGLKLSTNYVENAKYSLKLAGKKSGLRLVDMVAKWPVIHSRYAELTKADFVDPYPNSRGFRAHWTNQPTYVAPKAANTESLGTLSKENTKYIDKIIALSKVKKFQVVFFIAPFCVTEGDEKQFNALGDYLAKKHIPYIDFNKKYDELQFVFSKDMLETGHVNAYGAEKVTTYLGEMLHNHYAIPNRRGENGYELWNQDLQDWKNESRVNYHYES